VGRPGALRLGFHLAPGMTVGVLGGSFNPAHAGHRHLAETARVRLGLDRVLWLVTPQNPLKGAGAAPLHERMASAREQAKGPLMIVSDAEARIGRTYTYDTLLALQARHPGVRFVWLMGADNLAGFHRWRGWIDILRRFPVAVVSRPGSMLSSRFAPAAGRFAHARIPSEAASTLARRPVPAWVYITGPLNPLSSTELRARRAKAARPG
jgi:nicotinate-nucleotide adenylyltransferase